MGDLKELSDDIAKNGLINPPVVTPDFELIAGERRLEAMKKLGYKQVEVRIMKVEDAEHKLNLEINENENRKDFNKSERIEYARQLERIERVKAKERMAQGTENFPEVGETRDLVAEKMGIGSGKQYEKEKYIADNADPETLEQWNNEEISTHKAYTKVKELEKQLEESTAANKRLADKVIELEQREPEVIEKEVIPEDYKDLQDELKELMAYQKELENQLYEERQKPKEVVKEVERGDIKYLKSENKRLEEKLQKEITKNLGLISDKKLAISQLESEKAHQKIVDDISGFHYNIAGFIQANGGLLYLTEYLDEIPARNRNLFLDSIKHLREFSEQLYLNVEDRIKNI